MNKRIVSYEPVDILHHYSTIAILSLVQKKEDLGAFDVPCTIEEFKFIKALCDLGESTNLKPLMIFK